MGNLCDNCDNKKVHVDNTTYPYPASPPKTKCTQWSLPLHINQTI